MPYRNQEIFIISLLSLVQIWVLGVIFFLPFLVDILPIGSVDPHFLADPDPDQGIPKFADPDPKHCLPNEKRLISIHFEY